MLVARRFTGVRAGFAAVALLFGTEATLFADGTKTAGPEPGACRTIARPGEEAPGAVCCFTNPAYSGVCVVGPAENETCGSILAYLNNEQSVGRNYCDRTNIRGGWQQVGCETPVPPKDDAGR